MFSNVRRAIEAIQGRVAPHRLACYPSIASFFEGKVGLETGGPSKIFKRHGLVPVYASAARVDNCNFGTTTVWQGAVREGRTFKYDWRRPAGNQYICEVTELSKIGPSQYDFVLSSHVLEHSANPLRALSECIRLLKDEGCLVLVLPHRDGTFDHRRPVTPLAHLIQDYEQGTDETDLTHLDEILELHDLARDPGAGTFDAFKERSKDNFSNRCLHQHVFDTQLAVEIVHHAGLRILAVESLEPYHIFVIAQKPAAGDAVDNEEFRGLDSASCRNSPFPSDHAARA